jgi:hypothetical protein
MKRELTPLVVLACALTFACGGEKPSPAPPTPGGGATVAAPAAPATATAGIPPAAAAGDAIGIPECDDYLSKYEACVREKVPASQRSVLEPALQQYRAAWKQAAAQPATRANLAMTCQQATAAARTAMGAYGCQW